jgi:acetyl-CoA carboxylase carboxyltransferase component
MDDKEILDIMEKIKQGGNPEYKEKMRKQGKIFVRDRLKLLLDDEPDFEDGLFARHGDEEWLPADGVVTGVGKINGRTVCFLANDMTVKVGTWGYTTIEKMIRILTLARQMKVPIILLVDSAAGRLNEQHLSFSGRSHAGRVFWEVVRNSGVIPQISVLFGPSPAGSAYLPALTDITIMVDKNSTTYIGTPRMAEMVTGEKVSYEEMGGARMHCEVSGVGDKLTFSEEEAIEYAKRWLSFFPDNWELKPVAIEAKEAKLGSPIEEIVPKAHNRPFDIREVIERIVDEDSFTELKELWAKEVVTGLARLGGRSLGIIANQPAVKAGVLYADSADKVAKFTWMCNAFNIPLLYLQDNSGFMVGTVEERKGIIRHGAKMAWAVASATVPKISVIVRKAYGAGYMTMAGASFVPDACLALPNAKIGIMGPEAAINTMYYNKIQELQGQERVKFVMEKRKEYEQHLDATRAASEVNIDAIVPGEQLRRELIKRFESYDKYRDPRDFPQRRNGVYPV